MELLLRKMGNSTALVMPPSVLKALGMRAGQHLSLSTTAEGAILLTPKRKHTLEQLIAQCDLSAPSPEDLAQWDAAQPVGQELL